MRPRLAIIKNLRVYRINRSRAPAAAGPFELGLELSRIASPAKVPGELLIRGMSGVLFERDAFASCIIRFGGGSGSRRRAAFGLGLSFEPIRIFRAAAAGL